MAAPTEFTLETVREFMLARGGKVTNHELVKHFKRFLTDPYTKEYARIQFKEYVNTLALIRPDDGEKYLVLKPIFCPPGFIANHERSVDLAQSMSPPPLQSYTSPAYHSVGLAPLPPPPPAQQQQYVQPPYGQPPPPPQPSYGQPAPPMMMMEPAPAFRAPPPYRPPPEPVAFRRSSVASLSGSDPSHSPVYSPQQQPSYPPPIPAAPQNYFRQNSVPCDDFIPASAYLLPQQQPMSERSVSVQDFTSASSAHSIQDLTGSAAPAVPPRRLKAQRSDDKENHVASMASSCSSIDGASHNEEVKISVKERTQRFNKMASEVDLVQKNTSHSNLLERRDNKSKGTDDDDTSSVGTMEPRAKEWMLATARGDYHAIARLLREEPRLARRRDFVTYTGLHWAAKHGNDDLVKLLAGAHKSDVNARTNAGCTPLHLAAMQGHADVVDLLVKAYGADSNMRDYSGKKPHQYLSRPDTVISIDTFRKITAKRNLAAEKEAAAGFLRIGSLNVRVKKTTEAFNNLLSSAGASGTFSTAKMYNKPWGSIDNLPNSTADGLMLPPNKQTLPKKKRPKDWPQPLISAPTLLHHSNSFSGRPIQPALIENKDEYENDSDSAYGFGNNWQNT